MKGDSDEEAIRMANNCEFALSSCAFAGDARRAKKVASQLVAGMSAVNDLGRLLCVRVYEPYIYVYIIYATHKIDIHDTPFFGFLLTVITDEFFRLCTCHVTYMHIHY